MHSDAEIEYLEDTLLGGGFLLTAMMPSEFDGLVAGVLLCPEPISPKAWVPLVLGEPEELSELDPIEGQAILDALVAHYNRVAGNFMTKSVPYEAMIAFNGEDECFWELWVEGFSAVIDLMPEHFSKYAGSEDGHTSEAFAGLQMLIDCANGELNVPYDERAKIDAAAPELIPSIVVHMYLWLEQFGAPNGPLDDLEWDTVMKPLKRKTRH
jgi:uncharacterized protein